MFKISARILITLLLALSIAIACYYGYPAASKTHSTWNKSDMQSELKKLQSYSANAKKFCKKKGFNCCKCFFADMSLQVVKTGFSNMTYCMIPLSVADLWLMAHVIITFL